MTCGWQRARSSIILEIGKVSRVHQWVKAAIWGGSDLQLRSWWGVLANLGSHVAPVAP